MKKIKFNNSWNKSMTIVAFYNYIWYLYYLKILNTVVIILLNINSLLSFLKNTFFKKETSVLQTKIRHEMYIAFPGRK